MYKRSLMELHYNWETCLSQISQAIRQEVQWEVRISLFRLWVDDVPQTLKDSKLLLLILVTLQNVMVILCQRMQSDTHLEAPSLLTRFHSASRFCVHYWKRKNTHQSCCTVDHVCYNNNQLDKTCSLMQQWHNCYEITKHFYLDLRLHSQMETHVGRCYED